MAKFYGPIGFSIPKGENGIWEDSITERNYKGDVLKNTRKSVPTDKIHDDLDVNIRISIIADDYINQNFFAIRYITWKGASWKVTSVDIERPRLILTIGGVYNGPTV